ncbi:VDE lipocalin domain-containing protein [Aureococcus anophagefferens]|nr:VDE lipocalin domain-containing protein [Aureococcus anophagefferens]
MFGLTFWENWSVIGENAKDEPEFKFIHYSGKTSQNTYEGAFVYAREPTLPPAAKKSVYRIAKEAGMVPANFCAVRNDLATCGATRPRPTTPRTVGKEVASYLEDPHATERWVFAQQQKMGPGDD